MLSLAMIRVEPGSTPGIGITICEQFVFGFFVFCGRSVLLFCNGELVACSSGVEIFFDIATTYLQILGLGNTYYIKPDKVDKEHGYTGGTSSFRPPGHRYATSYSRND